MTLVMNSIIFSVARFRLRHTQIAPSATQNLHWVKANLTLFTIRNITQDNCRAIVWNHMLFHKFFGRFLYNFSKPCKSGAGFIAEVQRGKGYWPEVMLHFQKHFKRNCKLLKLNWVYCAVSVRWRWRAWNANAGWLGSLSPLRPMLYVTINSLRARVMPT